MSEAGRELGLTGRRVRQLIQEGKIEAERTPLGALRIPSQVVAEERVRRSGSQHDLRARADAPREGRRSANAFVVAALASGALVVGFLAGAIVRWAPSTPAVTSEPVVHSQAQQVVLLIDPPPDGGLTNPRGQLVDAFIPSDFSVRTGSPVRLTIYNYDDTPHTFTATGLSVDAVIPPALPTGPGNVTDGFTPTVTGSFPWHCRVQCNKWSMARAGYMRGVVRVMAA